MKEREALKALVDEMEYVLSCINEDKVSFDGDDFHEALRLGKEALAKSEQEKERCVGCEACIDTACGRDECPKGWPKAAQPEQEPVAWEAPQGHGIKRFISQSLYNNFAPEIRRWYRPFKCSSCEAMSTQRKPLTDEQICRMWNDWHDVLGVGEFALIARDIEAAHGIKE